MDAAAWHRIQEQIPPRTDGIQKGSSAAVNPPLYGGETKLTACAIPEETDRFGTSVAVDGDVVVVGARYQPGEGTINNGAAYIFERNEGGTDNWGQVAKLTASDTAGGDDFGTSVAIAGDVVLVGAYGNDSDTGSAYIYERNQGGTDAWGEVKKLTASDGATSDFFGWSVAIDGPIALVGARAKDGYMGAAYVFDRDVGFRDSWGQVTKLTVSLPEVNDNFGHAVAVDGDVALVSAYGDSDSGTYRGAAYVFERNEGGADNWGLRKRLTASDAEDTDYFGTSVTVEGTVAIVSAIFEDSAETNAGAAYVFERSHGGTDNWGEVKKLMASDAEADAYFGSMVSLSGEVLVVGTAFEDFAHTNAGAAYIFRRSAGGTDNWGEVKKLTPSDGVEEGRFGTSLAVAGDLAAVCAPGTSSMSGSVHIFEHTGMDTWGEVATPAPTVSRANEQLGCSVAVAGDVAVVGARYDDVGGDDAGTAYLYERNKNGLYGWGKVETLTAYDAGDGDHFGWSVAAAGDVVVVGAPGGGGAVASGAAYVYGRSEGGADTWGHVKKLMVTGGSVGDDLGASVATAGNAALVGAPGEDSDAGAAYVFDRNDDGGTNNWGQSIRLVADDAMAGDLFGWSVAMAGDVAVVGAPGEDSDAGAAYIFEHVAGVSGGWTQKTKLKASDAALGDLFGFSVAVAGDVVLVGAYGKDADTGTAYVFQRNASGTNGWGEVTALTASDGEGDDRFGYSVAAEGDVAVGAARQTDAAHADVGAVYTFQRNHLGTNTWGEVRKLTASDGASNDLFGASVSAFGDVVIVGARGVDAGPHHTDAGAAYVLQISEQSKVFGEVAELFGETPWEGDEDDDAFGGDVAVCGDVIVVGAPKEGFDCGGGWFCDSANVGGAYVYERDAAGANAWTRIKRLSASDGYGGDSFGGSVAVDGDVAVVGALGSTNWTGAAYIFHRNAGGINAWTQMKKLLASNGEEEDRFGGSVAVDGDLIVVGASRENDEKGSAYVFERNAGGRDNWGEVVKLTASDAAPFDSLGRSVAVAGDVIVVGASAVNGGSSDEGAAYVFERNEGGPDNWGEVKKLIPSDPQEQNHFGEGVAVEGDVLVVGAGGEYVGGYTNLYRHGAAYVFERNVGGTNNWGEVIKLTASDATTNDSFGRTVDIAGDRLVVRASGASFTAGAAYLFRRNAGGTNAWGEVAKLTASDSGPGYYFGSGVAVDGDVVAVGSPGYDDSSGKAYVYTTTPAAPLPPVIAITDIVPLNATDIVVWWQGEDGWNYSMEQTTHLNPANWVVVPGASNLPGAEALMSATNSLMTDPRAFFRVFAEEQ